MDAAIGTLLLIYRGLYPLACFLTFDFLLFTFEF